LKDEGLKWLRGRKDFRDLVERSEGSR
jgi:hypothetical protein